MCFFNVNISIVVNFDASRPHLVDKAWLLLVLMLEMARIDLDLVTQLIDSHQTIVMFFKSTYRQCEEPFMGWGGSGPTHFYFYF